MKCKPVSEQRTINQTFGAIGTQHSLNSALLSFAAVFKTIAFDLPSAFVRSKFKLFAGQTI